MKTSQTIGLYRLIIAIVVVVAVTTQLVYGIQNSQVFSVLNFFSFFTIESNILGAAVFTVAGWAAYQNRSIAKLAFLRGASTLYMAITGIVYSLLLANADVQTPIPWVNAVLHYIFPVLIVADWIIDPPKKTITFKKALKWLLFPVAYAAYSLIRGGYVHWYPYPFLNVDTLGYTTVAVNCVFVAVGGLAILAAIVGLPKLTKKN